MQARRSFPFPKHRTVEISLLPLYSKENPDPGSCLLDCRGECKVKPKAHNFWKKLDSPCPLSLHQVETCAEVLHGEAEVIFNIAATGDGKSLAAYLPALLDPKFHIMGLYPTIELVEDQNRHLKGCHQNFRLQQNIGLKVEDWIDRLYGRELACKVQAAEESNKFQELWLSIEHTPILLSNPDIFHLITHFQYRDIAYDPYTLVNALAQYVDLWVFDEFHIFSAHQEAAVLNSLLLIRSTQQRKRRFLFTSATPKHKFIEILKKAEFQLKVIGGKDYYSDKCTSGFRKILQEVKLEFVNLKSPDTLKDSDPLSWLIDSANYIRDILNTVVKTEEKIEIKGQGRGLIILNSVALVGRAVRELKKLLEPDIAVEEISGRIDSKERERIQAALKNEERRPVLVVGTSAVDVGVDFKIHLLIFEASDSATFIQRLGRLGRHEGFSSYKAFVLIPKRIPWIWSRLEKAFESLQTLDRNRFREIVEDVFDSPREFWEYRHRWGVLQAQGMLYCMSQGNSNDKRENKERQGVMQPIREQMTENMRRVYSALEAFDWYWKDARKDLVREAIQKQLLRFRGSSDLQAAVWDDSNNHSNFYTYDLLRLLPYVSVEVINQEIFLEAAKCSEHVKEEFPDKYIQVYLKLNKNSWLDERQSIELRCKTKPEELKPCTLSVIEKLNVVGHPQESDVNIHLSQKKLLAFIVPLDSNKLSDYWRIREMLYLNSTFGIHRLTDLNNDTYACAFNHDALLLDALAQRGKFKEYLQTHSQSSFF